MAPLRRLLPVLLLPLAIGCAARRAPRPAVEAELTPPTPYFQSGAWRSQAEAAAPEHGCVAVAEVLGFGGERFVCGEPVWSQEHGCQADVNCASMRTPGAAYSHLLSPPPGAHVYRTPGGRDVVCSMGAPPGGTHNDELLIDYDTCVERR